MVFAILASLSFGPTSCEAARPGACAPPETAVDARAAGCVVVDRDRLLLVQSSFTSRWSLPGGKIDPGESAAEAAVRETWEEAGVRVRAEAPVCVVPANGFVAYRCALTPSAAEIRDTRFMTRAEISALTADQLRFPDQRVDYLRFLDP